MNAITRSRHAMMLLAGAIGFYALGDIFRIIAYATLSGGSPNSYNTFADLQHAADWVQFVGALLALAAVCTTGWETMAERVADQNAELAAAAVATLLIAVGALVAAASSDSTSTADIVGAIGIGIWALLALTRAARLNLAGQLTPGTTSPLATSWLVAAGGLTLIAVSSGFYVGPTDQGVGIAVGILDALGFALIAWAMVSVRSRGLMGSVPARMVVSALAVLAIAGVVEAVVAGLVFTPNGTLKGLRIGQSIALTVRLIGLAILGWATWLRLGEIVSGRPAVARSGGKGWSWARPKGQPAGASDPGFPPASFPAVEPTETMPAPDPTYTFPVQAGAVPPPPADPPPA